MLDFQKATFAGGCFWCTEAIFKRLRGVVSVTSGYIGGKREGPSYEQVSTGVTGHAEAIQIEFDPSVISYDKLLEIFWHVHNPTTLNQQGNDIGSQYRSVIFYHDREQKDIAEISKKKIEQEGVYKELIVTEIIPYSAFYKAEEYHQNYYERNMDNQYCQYVITPKISKLLKEFKDEVKS